MPAYDLAEVPLILSRYDVVGEYGDPQTPFVTHVGLLATDRQELSEGSTVDAVHMSPPLTQDQSIVAHIVGQVPLTNDDRRILDVWIEEIRREYVKGDVNSSKRRQYTIYPDREEVCDPNRRAQRYTRYSCAGFVLEGHRQVGVRLLETDIQLLPQVNWNIIEQAYPRYRRKFLAQFGLTGDGPWPIVLPGYLLHSLNRSSEEIRDTPYQAKPGDEHF